MRSGYVPSLCDSTVAARRHEPVPKGTIQGAALATVMKEDGCTRVQMTNDYGPDGVAEAGFVDPVEGGIPANVAAKVRLTVATLSPDDYPPEGQEFFEQFRAKYDEPNPNPYAIYGYEAMRLALDAVARSETGEPEDILAALFETADRQSLLGTYSIDENGDTTLTDYGVYTVDDGELVFDRTIRAG